MSEVSEDGKVVSPVLGWRVSFRVDQGQKQIQVEAERLHLGGSHEI